MVAPDSESRSTSVWRHLPNVISALRIVLVAPIAVAIETHCFRLALWMVLVAGASDGIDGWLARRFQWRSHLGGVLDPVADKLLLVTCFVVLAIIGKVPLGLTTLVLGRDLVIAVGALAWLRMIGSFRARPSWVSKTCTAAQILYVLLVLLCVIGWVDVPMAPAIWLVAGLTLASGLDYVVRWGRLARRQLHRMRVQSEQGGTHES